MCNDYSNEFLDNDVPTHYVYLNARELVSQLEEFLAKRLTHALHLLVILCLECVEDLVVQVPHLDLVRLAGHVKLLITLLAVHFFFLQLHLQVVDAQVQRVCRSTP